MRSPRASWLGAIVPVAAMLLAGCVQKGPFADAEPLIAEKPRETRSWFDYGVGLLAASQPAMAERAFRRSMVDEGVTADTLTGAGIAAAQQGHMGAARRYLEGAQRLEPDSAEVNNTLGVVLFTMGDYYGAQKAFQTAFVVSSGTDPVASLNLKMSEEALLDAGLYDVVTDPAVTFDLLRTGGSEFLLTERVPDAAEAEIRALGLPAAEAPGDAAGDGAGGDGAAGDDVLARAPTEEELRLADDAVADDALAQDGASEAVDEPAIDPAVAETGPQETPPVFRVLSAADYEASLAGDEQRDEPIDIEAAPDNGAPGAG